MPHDFNKFPELTNNQMQFYYYESPHKQILEGFIGKVVKVTDGDTIRLKTDFRDFLTIVRLAYINAPELNEGGAESKSFLENQILNKEVYVKINPDNRVGKWGRIIGDVFHGGMSMSELALMTGNAFKFGEERFK